MQRNCSRPNDRTRGGLVLEQLVGGGGGGGGEGAEIFSLESGSVVYLLLSRPEDISAVQHHC